MSAAFTPGPWMAFKDRHDECYVIDTALGHPSTNVMVIADGIRGEQRHGNARLIAAAPDHALIGWAMCVQDATWEEWGDGKGEFCFAGLRHATTLDEFGCPVLTENLRERLSEARGDQTKETME